MKIIFSSDEIKAMVLTRCRSMGFQANDVEIVARYGYLESATAIYDAELAVAERIGATNGLVSILKSDCVAE